MKLARKVFRFPMNLFITKPKDAVIAEDENSLAGGAIYRFLIASGEKIGHLEWGFVDRKYRGRGIGKELYSETTRIFSDEGCSYMTAAVLRDNTASWRPLYELGYRRCGFRQLVRLIGPFHALRIWQKTASTYFPGGDLWLKTAADDNSGTADDSPSGSFLLPFFKALLFMFTANSLAVTGRSLIFGELPSLLPGIMGVAAAVAIIIIPKLLMLVLGKNMEFRAWGSGALLAAGVTILHGYFPILGNVYPKGDNWKYPDYSRIFGVFALFGWLLTLTAFLICRIFSGNLFAEHISANLGFVIVANCIPGLFQDLDGARVRRWIPRCHYVMAAASIIILLLLIFADSFH